MILTDLAQYWFHRAFHRIPFLWGFHAVHHSARSMDWLAGARCTSSRSSLLRGLTSLPLLTLGFAPSVMQAYIGFVYVYSSLVHANLRGDFDRLGRFLVTPRYHHWHHAIEAEGGRQEFRDPFPLARPPVRHPFAAGREVAERLWRAASRWPRLAGGRRASYPSGAGEAVAERVLERPAFGETVVLRAREEA